MPAGNPQVNEVWVSWPARPKYSPPGYVDPLPCYVLVMNRREGFVQVRTVDEERDKTLREELFLALFTFEEGRAFECFNTDSRTTLTQWDHLMRD